MVHPWGRSRDREGPPPHLRNVLAWLLLRSRAAVQDDATNRLRGRETDRLHRRRRIVPVDDGGHRSPSYPDARTSANGLDRAEWCTRWELGEEPHWTRRRSAGDPLDR